MDSAVHDTEYEIVREGRVEWLAVRVQHCAVKSVIYCRSAKCFGVIERCILYRPGGTTSWIMYCCDHSQPSLCNTCPYSCIMNRVCAV